MVVAHKSRDWVSRRPDASGEITGISICSIGRIDSTIGHTSITIDCIGRIIGRMDSVIGHTGSTIGGTSSTIGGSDSTIDRNGIIVGRIGSTIVIKRCDFLDYRCQIRVFCPPMPETGGKSATIWRGSVFEVVSCASEKALGKPCSKLATKKKNSLDPSASIRNLHPRCVLQQAGHEIGSILVCLVERAFHLGRGARCIKGRWRGAEGAANRIVVLYRANQTTNFCLTESAKPSKTQWEYESIL